jgi:hypothetical protein
MPVLGWATIDRVHKLHGGHLTADNQQAARPAFETSSGHLSGVRTTHPPSIFEPRATPVYWPKQGTHECKAT